MVQTTVGGSLGETDDDLRWLVDYIQTNDPDGEGYYQAYTHKLQMRLLWKKHMKSISIR